VSIRLPDERGGWVHHTFGEPMAYRPPREPARSRVAFAAAHVVASDHDKVDWGLTMAYRRHLWQYGLGVAEAMDTAQRGMGLDWLTARELMLQSMAEARAVGGDIVCGAATDQLGDAMARPLDEIIHAYQEQCSLIEGGGGRVVMMASRHLALSANDREDYERVYADVLGGLRRPAILHWLGAQFDPALAGYWGSAELSTAAEVCLAIIESNREKIDGIKLSTLDSGFEVRLRSRLPLGVRMYTGDDFNYPELVRGDGVHHSDALLGILDAIAPAFSAALAAADAADWDTYERVLKPTVELSRHIFIAPTFHYKAGLVFLAWLNGHQPKFRLVAGLESARSLGHYGRVLVLADQAGLLVDPELACFRMRSLLE
jgi:uncharacterized protein DUF993